MDGRRRTAARDIMTHERPRYHSLVVAVDRVAPVASDKTLVAWATIVARAKNVAADATTAPTDGADKKTNVG
jgi:hypothetical protein